MNVATRKFLWWSLLASSVVMAGLFITIVASIRVSKIPLPPKFFYSCVAVAGVESFIAFVSIFKLRRCYREQPLNWSGRWQLSLIEFMTIPFFIALIMAVLQGWSRQFGAKEIILSLLLGAGYAVSLLCVSKMETWPTVGFRCAYAISYLVQALLFIAIASFFHYFALHKILFLLNIVQ